MNYLKKKNKLFYAMASELQQEGRLLESLFLLEADGSSEEEIEFFSLIALYFDDEEGYQRALFIPWPIVKKSKSKISKIIKESLENIPYTHIVSREWHDVRKVDNSPPQGYYPPEGLLIKEGDEKI